MYCVREFCVQSRGQIQYRSENNVYGQYFEKNKPKKQKISERIYNDLKLVRFRENIVAINSKLFLSWRCEKVNIRKQQKMLLL